MTRFECFGVAIVAAGVVSYPLELVLGPSLVVTTLFPCLTYVFLRFCAAQAGHKWPE